MAGDDSARRLLLAVGLLATVAGVGLRVVSFTWNDRLQGDVNLFALTAREFVQNGRLHYPMKYEYSDNVEYLALHTPASQHPPLWPLVAGLLGKVLSTDNTFVVLKAMCEVIGAALLAVVAAVGLRRGYWTEAVAALSCLALSPMLVDFSANGSSYGASAFILLLAALLLRRFEYDRKRDYVLLGLLCALGMLVHSVMIAIPVAFLLSTLLGRARPTWRGLLALVATALLILAPWMAWNVCHFGRPFYSYSAHGLLKHMGLRHRGIYDGVITTRVTGSIDGDAIRQYLSLVTRTIPRLVADGFMEVGPFCVLLAAAGCVRLLKENWRRAAAVVVPYALYGITVFLWPVVKDRRVVPCLPGVCLAAGLGFGFLLKRARGWKLLAWALLIGTIAWGVPAYFDENPTRYYGNDDDDAAAYYTMLPLATEVRDLEPGVMLGYSRSLDGGIETVYWHGYPFVHARGLGMSEVHKLVLDFGIRYVWSDHTYLGQVLAHFPEARIALQNEYYSVVDLTPEPTLEEPQEIRAVDVSLGEHIALEGYELNPTTIIAGDVVRLTLLWRSDGGLQGDYHVFVHLQHAQDNSLAAQHDSVPVYGSRPTWTWLAGELVVDGHVLFVNSSLPSGTYVLSTGMYDWVTGARLAAFGSDGHRFPEDRVVLCSLQIPEGEEE